MKTRQILYSKRVYNYPRGTPILGCCNLLNKPRNVWNKVLFLPECTREIARMSVYYLQYLPRFGMLSVQRYRSVAVVCSTRVHQQWYIMLVPVDFPCNNIICIMFVMWYYCYPARVTMDYNIRGAKVLSKFREYYK